MKAALFHGPHRALEVVDVPTPAPGPGEVLVKVAGCGLCHTDLHYLDHGVDTFKRPPLILGHEAAGIIAALGPETDGRAVGDRVLIPAVLSCGWCPYCRQGRENLCSNLVMLGNNVDGAYAEYVVVPARELVPVPEGVPLEQACVIADAVSTPYHAVKHRGRVRLGDTVAVVGCGGVGLNGSIWAVEVPRTDTRTKGTATPMSMKSVIPHVANSDATSRLTSSCILIRCETTIWIIPTSSASISILCRAWRGRRFVRSPASSTRR